MIEYKAKPDLWEYMEKVGQNPMDVACAILELRARVEALEAAKRPAVKQAVTRDRDETGDFIIIHDAPAPTGALVERIADAIERAILKEQALEALGPEPSPEPAPQHGAMLNAGEIRRHQIIRRALEQLSVDILPALKGGDSQLHN